MRKFYNKNILQYIIMKEHHEDELLKTLPKTSENIYFMYADLSLRSGLHDILIVDSHFDIAPFLYMQNNF